MAVVDVLPAATAAGTSSAFTCDGIAEITVGMYATLPINERVGVNIRINTPGGYKELRDEEGRVVVLTQADPQYAIRQAGEYTASKGTSVGIIGVFVDDGL